MMKIAFLFSGQGAQYPGMMKDLYETEAAAKGVFEAADSQLGRSVSGLCFDGAQEELNLTHNTQPCVLAADLAAAMALKAHGIEPDVTAGFSLGEYAALTFAGAIPMEDVFSIIQVRADAMQEAVAPGIGAMAALVGGSPEKIEEICAKVNAGYVVAANYNSPVQTVISGTAEGVDEAIALAGEEGIRAVKLAVSAPFHCELMKPAAMKLAELFKTGSFAEPTLPVYMNVNAQPLQGAAQIADLLVQQAMSPVRWVQTLQNMQAAGVDTFIECGPGKTLSGLVKKTLKGVKILRVENQKTLEETLAALAE
ncbi:MAG: ACP S-malonyltransferase [Clostridia bacterium]|nr:ACP S-malonyltransferase [Clostridia bacterium]